MERPARQVFRSVIAAFALLTMSSNAMATAVDVYAAANSSTGGVGATSLTFSPGQWFTVTAAPTDLWNAGPPFRWSNADGLIGDDLYAIDGDDSGYLDERKIGEAFPLYSQDGLTAPYGALVGRIGGGSLFLIGTNFLGQTATGGLLELFYLTAITTTTPSSSPLT